MSKRFADKIFIYHRIVLCRLFFEMSVLATFDENHWRACHPIRHLTRRVGPPWRKDLLTKLSCTTESYCAGFLGLATFKTEFWPFQRLSMISGGKGVEMYTLLVFGNPFPETRVVTPSTQPTGAPLAPGSVCSGRSRRKPCICTISGLYSLILVHTQAWWWLWSG